MGGSPRLLQTMQVHFGTEGKTHLPGAADLSLSAFFLPQHSSIIPSIAGISEEQAGPNISRLAPHLQEEWEHAANAHLGSRLITPQSGRKVWWSSGVCKAGQPHRWQAQICNRTKGSGCPHEAGRAVCPCNSLAHNHPEVAAEWDWNANGERTPETVTAHSQAAWRCGLCLHSWTARILLRTRLLGSGCPQCAHEAGRFKARQPSISSGPPHLLAEWDWEANETHGWHPDLVTLGSPKKVHWVVREECKLGLVHRWQATPNVRIGRLTGSLFPSGKAVCACNSLAVQCPEAADLWDFPLNGGLNPNDVAVYSNKVRAWRGPDGKQWQQRVFEAVGCVMRERVSAIKANKLSRES